MGVTVNKPGICTTIQDLGRRGYLGSGFSPSGVMDKRAARIANLLVDNGENAPSSSSAWRDPRCASPPTHASRSRAATSHPP